MKKKNIKILSGLFEETEQVSLTNKELDNSLLEIGLNPDMVVINGLERIKKHIELKDSYSATTSTTKIIQQDFDSMPIAASNQHSNNAKEVHEKKS